MVSTRRSQGGEGDERGNGSLQALSNERPASDRKKTTPKNKSTPSSSSAANKRNRKKEIEQALRLKSTGLGLAISIDNGQGGGAPKTGRKIVFPVDDVDDGGSHDATPLAGDQTGEDSETMLEKQEKPISAASDESDDDDDAVEEVKQTDAREELNAQRFNERASAVVNVTKGGKRRKRKNRLQDSDALEDADDLPSGFFEELDAELAHGRKARKTEQKSKDAEPKGKHTTFVVQGDDAEDSTIRVDDTIQLVILESKDRTEANEEVSTRAMIYSRSQLLDGKDKISDKKRQLAKKAGRKTIEPEGWVRSSKMNRLLVPGRAALRKAGKGAVAPRFVAQGSK